jgi:hypothetical protein
VSLPLGPGDLGGLYGDPSAPKLLAGVTANDPGSITGPLFVTINSFGPQQWGPCPFTPRGSSWPSAGLPCLVALDDDGQPWVVVWWPG